MKDWIKTLLTALITILITSIFSYIFWNYQFKKTNEQARYEHKLTSIEKFSKGATYMILLLRSMDRIHLDERKAEDSILLKKYPIKYKVLIDSPFNYVGSEIDYIKREQIMQKIRKEDQMLYTAYTNALTYDSDYKSNYYAVIPFFSPNTVKLINTLDNMLGPDYFHSTVLLQLQQNKKSFLKLDYGPIDKILNESRTAFLKKVIESMGDELTQNQ